MYFLREHSILNFSTNLHRCSWHCFEGYFTRKRIHSMFLSAKDYFSAMPLSFWGKFSYFWVAFKNFVMGFYNNDLGVNLTPITLKINAACLPLLYIILFHEDCSDFPHQILYNRFSNYSNNRHTIFFHNIYILGY